MSSPSNVHNTKVQLEDYLQVRLSVMYTFHHQHYSTEFNENLVSEVRKYLIGQI
jgi:hypothetical protein